MTWTFIWLMLLIKIPIGGMMWIVWWAIKKADEEPVASNGDDDGGTKLRKHSHRRPPRPRPYSPRHPRRGPHAGAPPAAPPRTRTRTVTAYARKVEH
jgi:hypothetical protein